MIDKELYEILKMFINNKSYCLNEILNKEEVIKAHRKCPTASVRRSVDYLLSNGYLRYCNKNIKANAVIPNNEKIQITVKGRVEKVPQGVKTESVPLGELKKLAEERMLLFDEEIMTFTMGNCITMEDTNGNRKLFKKRYEHKIDAMAALMDAYIAYKVNIDAFE